MRWIAILLLLLVTTGCFDNILPDYVVPELREVVARDVGSKRGVSYDGSNVSIQPGGKPVIGKFISAVMEQGD